MHGKPTADGADEVLQGSWPDYNEDDFGAEAQKEFAKARHIEDDVLKNVHEGKQHAADHMSGELAEGIQTKLGIRVSEYADTIAAHCNTAGWLMAAQTAIATAKTAMAAACDSHEAIHKQPVKQNHGGKFSAGISQESKDADLKAKQAAVAQAKAALEGAMASVRSGISANTAPPAGTPAIPAAATAAPRTEISPGTGRSDMVAKPPAAGAFSPENTNPGLNNPAAPGGTPAPASPFAGSGGPASPFNSASSAAPSAPAAPSAGASEAGAGLGAGAGAGSGSPAAGSGAPMSGMPMAGGGMPQMPQMQPPQMPSQTPGNDIAKTVGDTVGKLAGGNQGTPVSEAALDKLLERQSPSTSTGPDGASPAGEGSGVGGKETSTEGKNEKKEGTHLLGQGPQHPADPYSAANTNPALNNPGAPEGKAPSPASPTVTATPTVSAPVTELSADENAGRSGSATAVSAAGVQHQPPPGEAHTHTSANTSQQTGQGNWNPFGQNNSSTLTPNPGLQTPGQSPSQALAAYTPGGLTPPPPPPMTGATVPPPPPPAAVQVPSPQISASTTPMLGVVPAATAIARKTGLGGKNTDSAAPGERITTLPPEHATADMHLAGLVRSFTAHEWAGTVIAVGVFVDTDPQPGRPGLRYVIATSDGVSHLPLGVPVPAGVELLEDQNLAPSFTVDWNGHWRAGLKLAAYARTHSGSGELVYLVSNDSDGILNPAKAGGVLEVVQSDGERQHLMQTGHASAAVLHRATVSRPRVEEKDAGEYLTKLGDAWGFNDGTEESHMSAISRLWAARWDQHRDRDPEYQAVLATYLLVEGEEALRQGRLLDAAYAVTKMAMVEPPINA